jgi:hypothetical protein
LLSASLTAVGVVRPACYVSIRQHTSAYVSTRQRSVIDVGWRRQDFPVHAALSYQCTSACGLKRLASV